MQDIYQPTPRTVIQEYARPKEAIFSPCDIVCIDVDSTLIKIEGIDELAGMKGVHPQVAALTAAAMNGEISFDDVFKKRLDIIQPTKADITALGELCCNSLTEGAAEMVTELQRRGLELFVVSGGYGDAVRMVTRLLGIPDDHVFANELKFDPDTDNYIGFDENNPLCHENGKEVKMSKLMAERPGAWSVMIGDGASDMRVGAHRHVYYAQHAERPNARALADVVVTGPLTNVLACI